MSLYSALTQVLAPFAAKIKGIQTGYDGTEYNSPGEAVRGQINDLHVLIGDVPGTAIQASAVAYNDSNVAAELTNVNGRLHQLQNVSVTETDGYIDGDGSIKAQDATRLEKYTNTVSVLPGEKFTAELSYTSAQWMWYYYALYDASGAFVRRENVPDSSGKQDFAEIEITIPDGIYGIAFTYRTYGISDFVLTVNQSINDIMLDMAEVKGTLDGDVIPTIEAVEKNTDDSAERISQLDMGHLPVVYEIVNGAYIGTSGEYVENTGHTSTSHFPVVPGEVLYVKNPRTTYNNAWYDENNEFISKFRINGGNPTTVTVPSTARYAAISNTNALFFPWVYREGLTTEINTLSNKIENINVTDALIWSTKTGGNFLNAIKSEVGNLSGSGAEVASTTRIRSSHFSNSQTGLYIVPASGYMFGFGEYTTDGYVWSGWKKVATEIPVGSDIRVLFDSDPSGSETADVDTWNECFAVRTYEDIRLITALQGDFISICHRGYPESGSDNYNLLPGYARAKKHGFNWCETDLKITNDGYIVCCHDNTFTDATTGEVITIADHTLAELQTYDYHGGQIPLLEDILKSCKLNGLGLVLDQLIEGIILDKTFTAVKAYGMQKKVAYLCGVKADAESVARSRIQAVLAHDPSARIFVTPTTKDSDSLAVTICNDYQTAANRIDLSLNVTTHTPTEVKELSEELNNGTIVVYTTDVVSTYLSYVPYVTGITSNKVALSSLLIRG